MCHIMKRTTLVLLNDVLIRYKNTSRSTATISYTCLRQYRYSSTIRQPFAENQGALKGVKILDLSRVLAVSTNIFSSQHRTRV